MRLPSRFQTQRIYALSAAAVALPWSIVFAGALPFLGLVPIWYLPLVAAFMGALLWPEHERTGSTLTISALISTMTVLFTAGFLVGVSFALPMIRGEVDEQMAGLMIIWTLFSTPFAALILGSLVTLGLPYVSAIGVSWLFREHASGSDDTGL